MNQQPPIPHPTGETFPSNAPGTGSHVAEVAAAQKLLLWSVASTLTMFVIPFLAPAVWAFQIWAAYNMGKTLRLTNVWLWVLGTMIPLAGILVLLRMNGIATSTLQSAGVRVGLMGANATDLNQSKDASKDK